MTAMSTYSLSVSTTAMLFTMQCLISVVAKSASGGSLGSWSLTGESTGYLEAASGLTCFLSGT